MTREERWHPLREELVVVAAHRQNRPWNGETVGREEAVLPDCLPDCYLCPGAERVSGKRNDDYTCTLVFDNDHPCVGPDAPRRLDAPPGVYRNRPATGVARVVCYSPRHNLTLAELEPEEIVNRMRVWQGQHLELGAREEINHVLIFENKGEVVGVSNPHPHCQIYATNFVFKTIETETRVSGRHLAETGRILFQDVLKAEEADSRRILVRRNDALSFIPYFARYPYETYVAPRETRASLADLTAQELDDFAAVLRETLIRLDNLWRMSFPYVIFIHPAPTERPYPGFHFHIEIHPPLRKP